MAEDNGKPPKGFQQVGDVISAEKGDGIADVAGSRETI